MINSKKPINSTSKPTILQFSDLNDNKKNEFLQFLLRNNITFQKNIGNDQDGYVAKLAVPKRNNHDKQNRVVKGGNNLNKSLIKSKQKSKTKPLKNETGSSCLRPQFEKSTIKITTPKKENEKFSQSTKKISTKVTPVQEQKQTIREAKQGNKSTNIKSSKAENKKKPYQASKSIKTTEFLTHSNQINSMNRSLEMEDKNKKLVGVKSTKNRENVKEDYLMEKQRCRIESNKSVSRSPHLKNRVVSSKEKIVEVNTKIKRKTEEQKQICDLVNKYLKIFDLKFQGQRPIKWPIAQLLKVIEEIYNDLFAKNTQSISQRGNPFRQFFAYNQGFVKFIKQHFIVKHKSQKSSNSNLINMLYSLSCYLQNEKKIIQNHKNYVREIKACQSMTATGIYMQNFEDFVSQVYQFEDLLFYLFIRNIILNKGDIMNTPKIKMEKEIRAHLFEKQIILNYKQIVKILNAVLGQDPDLVEQYKIMILTHINSRHQGAHHKTQQTQIKISVPEFIATLVEDYRSKRLLMQQHPQLPMNKKMQNNNSLVNYSLASQNTFEEVSSKRKQNVLEKQHEQNINLRTNNYENQTDQLTFGEQTQSNLQKYFQNQISIDFCKQFWESTEETAIFQTLPANSVEHLICEKLQQKVNQFINILIDNKSEYNSIENKKMGQKFPQNEVKQLCNFILMQKSYIIELFMKKSLNLLGSLIQMNKLKWFQELKVADPDQDDIDRVEQLQLNYRKLKSNPDAQGIGKLCKNLLTVPQITVALEKLICF